MQRARRSRARVVSSSEPSREQGLARDAPNGSLRGGGKIMPYRIFTIPVHGGNAATEELNAFLAGHRIAQVDREFVADGGNSQWTFCVSYLGDDARPGKPGKPPKVDYREVLNEADFALFSKLRMVRKQIADGEGVPVYAIFSNQQLAEMARQRCTSATALRQIDGVGEARAEKHGETFLAVIRAEPLPTRQPPAPASRGDEA